VSILPPFVGAQALSGTYTCANGNPGAAFDYGDIGAFFDDLEDFGVGGPVVLDIYDDGGPFTSAATYQLGADGNSLPDPVVGLSAANTLVIRAAAGEHPEIIGAAAKSRYFWGSAGLSFDNIPNTTVQGLDIHGVGGHGIVWVREGGPCSHVLISRCRVYDRPGGYGIVFYGWGSPNPIDNVTIENNMIWNLGAGSHACYSQYQGVEWIIRHNTVVHYGGSVFQQSAGVPWSVFENNVIYLQGNGTAIQTGGTPPVNVDGNIMYLSAGGSISNPYTTWAQWQASGRDLNGLNADPLLVNVTPGFEDLRLQPNSPARDFLPFAPVSEDIFGNPRPMGAAYDSGAHEFEASKIEVEYNSAPIANAGSVDVGSVFVQGETRTFTIRNPHAADLILTGSPAVVLTPGANCDVATAVQTQPAQTTIPQNGSITFIVLIDPVTAGPVDLHISIASNDVNANPFTFTVTGTAVNNAAAMAQGAAGTSFIGSPGGPFVIMLDPGDPLANADIELTDLEGDTITVASIDPVTLPVPAGIVAPIPPAPGHPVTLTWTGVADAPNPPDHYIWSVQFSDAVNGSNVICLVHITINDLPPNHANSGATGGDGSTGNPYTASFDEGDGASAGVDLATFTDPNTSQTVSIAGVTPSGTNPQGGSGFAFSIAGNALHAAPAGTLTDMDAGTHAFTLDVTDGFNYLQISVTLTVTAAPPPPPTISITTTTLPDGTMDQAYSQTIQTADATGAVTFSVQSGSLPPGLSLATGTIAGATTVSGTPTQDGTFSFTIQAADSLNTATQQFDLLIQPAPTSNPPGNDNSNSGCTLAAGGIARATPGSALALGALVLLLGLLGAGRRRRVSLAGNLGDKDGSLHA
jgi:hypothetical protein